MWRLRAQARARAMAQAERLRCRSVIAHCVRTRTRIFESWAGLGREMKLKKHLVMVKADLCKSSLAETACHEWYRHALAQVCRRRIAELAQEREQGQFRGMPFSFDLLSLQALVFYTHCQALKGDNGRVYRSAADVGARGAASARAGSRKGARVGDQTATVELKKRDHAKASGATAVSGDVV